jgi:hypothetical protein
MPNNPAVPQWIRQMADSDQAVAFYAYQCLQEEVLYVTRPGAEPDQTALAGMLGEALTAQAKPGAGSRGADSFRSNAFLMAATQQRTEPLHPARVRNHLARLLGYLAVDAAVPPLARALQDLEVREMARQSLEGNPSPRATDALIAVINSPGPVFCAGVISSLAKRGGPQSLAAIRKDVEDAQTEVRSAALTALSAFPDASLDAILERNNAHVARARLAETLRATGNRAAAERIYKAILSGNAPESQKKAARLGLQSA